MLSVLRFILRRRCLTVASQVRYTECARFGCQVSRYRRYLARISYTRVIQRSGSPYVPPAARNRLRSVRSFPRRGTTREIMCSWNTLDLARNLQRNLN